MSDVALRLTPQLLAGSLCAGLALANVMRVEGVVALLVAAVLGSAATVAAGPRRVVLTATALALAGLWWGSARLDALDRSPLVSRLGTAGHVLVTVTGPARRGTYDVRAPAVVTQFAGRGLCEPVQLKLPSGRAPPQGAILDALVRVTARADRRTVSTSGRGSGVTESMSCCSSTAGGSSGGAVGSAVSLTP